MEFEFRGNKIKFERVLSNLDTFAISFVQLLEKHKIKYVIISGYVAILLGRSRNTEDIDIFIEKIGINKFKEFWDDLNKFECINAFSAEEAYNDFLMENHAIRFARRGGFMPNIEFKFTKTEVDRYSLEEAIEVHIDQYKLRISPLELQIPYKLSLGSEKDIEDAMHLWDMFKDSINKELFLRFAKELNVENKLKELG